MTRPAITKGSEVVYITQPVWKIGQGHGTEHSVRIMCIDRHLFIWAVENEARNLATSGMKFFIPIDYHNHLGSRWCSRLRKSSTGKDSTLLEAQESRHS